ncbi:hypothetical protein EJD97_015483 [Solanum chilense]|uniref:cytochrome-c oxidase n=1 Tax=Solanum chilense TaxID=4083 RepID=A0A6N2C7H0_SOLCI|nr:hypothetical protein EJD97_015483 [Solanum chilense]
MIVLEWIFLIIAPCDAAEPWNVHGTTIDILQTIFPSIIPMFIAIPSFALLYSMDEVVVDPAITIEAIGHQWYRSVPLH